MSNIFNYMGPLEDDRQVQYLTPDPVFKLDDPRALDNNFLQPLDSAALLKAIRNKELNDLYSNPTFQAQVLGARLAGNLLNKTSDYLLSRTEDGSNVNNVQDRMYGSTWGDIFNQSSNRQEINSTINNNIRTFDDVRNNANLSTLWDNNDYQLGVNKLTGGQAAGAIGTSIAAGAASGAATGAAFSPIGAGIGAIIGAAANGLKSSLNVIQGNKTVDMTNSAIRQANNRQFNNYFDQARSNRRAMYRNFEEGGPMESLNGLTFFNTGGTHGSNPLGGIPQGIDSEGVPNLVEQGEVKYNDYIFSSRNKISERLLNKYNLPKTLAGKTFAEVATKLQEDSQERPYDPVSMNGLEDSMNKLMAAQEEVRAKKASRNNMSMQELENVFAGGGPFTGKFSSFNIPDWNSMSYRERIQYAKQLRDNRRAAGIESNPVLDAAQQNISAGYTSDMRNAFGVIQNRQNVADENSARNSNEEILYGEQANYIQSTNPNISRREALLQAKNNPNTPRMSAPTEKENLNLYSRKDNTMPSDLKNAGFYYKDAQNYMRAHNLPFTVENYKRAYNQMRLSGSPDEFRKSGVNAPLRNGYGAKPITSTSKPKNQNTKAVTNIKSEGATTYRVTSKGKAYRVKANSPEEAKEIVNNYLTNGNGSTSESTRTSVKVSEKVRVPAGSRVSISTTSRKKETTQAPPLVTPEEKPVATPAQNPPANTNATPKPDVELEDNTKDDNEQKIPKYRRNPFATAAMMAPAIGSIGQALTDALGITNRPDYYVEQGLRRNASELNPIAPKLNTDYQEYRPYDVNLMNNQLLAQEYGAQRAARENFNKHTQAAQLLALNNAFGNMGFLANLQAQQANDAKRNATLQWNHGINRENAATVAAYDEINQGIKQQRLNMLNQAIQAKDASDTARAQVTSANRAAALTDLGSLGRYINDTNLTQALINSGVFGKLNTDMSDAYGNLQLFNLFRE